ncbi:9501_t:CDS:2 [Gigaspora margarita]|uniref:9501_t:CDS:1 n=1 Tax=Gigaspora margarita TaxID=4874 RepID=A0ABN7W220_GIGMA|nr:9501_t:CDS:2 [Gigaspora margarita]
MSTKRYNLRNITSANLEMKELTKRVEELEELRLAFDKPEIVAEKIQSFWNNESKRKLLLALFNKIWDEIKDKENIKEVDWDDIKRSYNDKSDKEAFLKNFHEEWLIKREHVVAKNQNLVLDDVILKRTKFLLLANYLIMTNDKNMVHLKYYHVIYQRVAELHNIIGEKILLLPVPIAVFTGHDNGRKVQQLIDWFRTAKKNSDISSNMSSDTA